MVLFNYATKEITAKVVYYGPGLCGKTTNLQFIYDSLPSNNKSKMLSLATKTDRTLFFDFLPLDLGKIRGMRTKLQLYTVPGQVYYNSTRQLVLKGADGVVFVADSQDFALDANIESFQNLEDNLKRQGMRLTDLPLVLQYNKRDLPNALPVSELEAALNKRGIPSFETVATSGLGVEQTVRGVTQLVLNHLVKKYGLEGSEPIEKEIHILNPLPVSDDTHAPETIWSDDNVLATTVATPGEESPFGDDPGYVLDDDDEDDNVPLVSAELIPTAKTSSFDDLIDRFEPPTAGGAAAAPAASASSGRAAATVIEFEEEEEPFPSEEAPAPLAPFAAAPAARSLPQVPPPPAAGPEPERRMMDGLVKEVTLPLNLSIEELRKHRKLKLKITIDVNLI